MKFIDKGIGTYIKLIKLDACFFEVVKEWSLEAKN